MERDRGMFRWSSLLDSTLSVEQRHCSSHGAPNARRDVTAAGEAIHLVLCGRDKVDCFSSLGSSQLR